MRGHLNGEHGASSLILSRPPFRALIHQWALHRCCMPPPRGGLTRPLGPPLGRIPAGFKINLVEILKTLIVSRDLGHN